MYFVTVFEVGRNFGFVRRPEGRRLVVTIETDFRDGVDWINLALDRDQWWAVANTVTNLRIQ
jgi:hypothetical protein